MTIVVDTNCVLASIPPKSNFYWFYEAFVQERFQWAVSNEVLAEYEEKIADRYSPKTASLVISLLDVAPNVIFIEPFFKWNLIDADPDDNKFADLAICSNSKYLVTNDKDFNCLKNCDFPKVNVISFEVFKGILMPGPPSRPPL